MPIWISKKSLHKFPLTSKYFLQYLSAYQLIFFLDYSLQICEENALSYAHKKSLLRVYFI